jgi:hypothetical protein
VATDQNVTGGGRYFLMVPFAAAAMAPLLAHRSATARYLVVAGVSIYALAGVLNLDQRDASLDLQADAGRVAIEANEVLSIARQEQTPVGYAGYFDAAETTWSTKFEVQVFPVQHSCEAGDGVPCPYPFNVHTGWYVPRDGVRTFLIGPADESAADYEPPAALGPPESTHRLLSGATLYVYPYDIASRLPPVELIDDPEEWEEF